MSGFRVDPIDLTALGASIERTEPFSGLAAAALGVFIPGASTAGTYAIERFTDRLVRELTDLSTASGSLGRATRSAAAGYRETEDSISAMSSS